jgi:hypothetical protein
LLIVGIGFVGGADETMPLVCEARRAAMPTALPTEEWTAEWLSGYSDLLSEADAERNRRTADVAIRRRASMFDARRGESSARPGIPAPTMEEALAISDRIVEGRVTEQFLEPAWIRGFEELGQQPHLTSILRTEDGEVSISQGTGVSCGSGGLLTLVYVSQNPLLKPNTDIALLATGPDPNDFHWSPIARQVYEVNTGGVLRRLSYDDADVWGPLTLVELRRMFAEAHPEE